MQKNTRQDTGVVNSCSSVSTIISREGDRAESIVRQNKKLETEEQLLTTSAEQYFVLSPSRFIIAKAFQRSIICDYIPVYSSCSIYELASFSPAFLCVSAVLASDP